MFKTCIPIKFKDKNRMITLLSEIELEAEKKGEKFDWYITACDIKGYDNTIVIISETKNQAHRRGLLIVKKYAEDLKLYYWVKPKA